MAATDFWDIVFTSQVAASHKVGCSFGHDEFDGKALDFSESIARRRSERTAKPFCSGGISPHQRHSALPWNGRRYHRDMVHLKRIQSWLPDRSDMPIPRLAAALGSRCGGSRAEFGWGFGGRSRMPRVAAGSCYGNASDSAVWPRDRRSRRHSHDVWVVAL